MRGYLSASKGHEVDQLFWNVDRVSQQTGGTCQLRQHHVTWLVRMRCGYTLSEMPYAEWRSLHVETGTQRLQRCKQRISKLLL